MYNNNNPKKTLESNVKCSIISGLKIDFKGIQTNSKSIDVIFRIKRTPRSFFDYTSLKESQKKRQSPPYEL